MVSTIQDEEKQGEAPRENLADILGVAKRQQSDFLRQQSTAVRTLGGGGPLGRSSIAVSTESELDKVFNLIDRERREEEAL